ncbi:TPA: hypothetical protein ACMEVV_005565 [Klebsiella quasipneumoniae subsp. quasipneumoniae]|uniref:hypothetical protein n=1 Tax=Klebsiella pneumoniae complex TaxID=3390273 RepID=UPI0029D45B33|nr:hypothetical protein [Klebsiella pneumoniae]MDX7116454.1 hypothetical protein [Klebsiella pneumoniae]
MEKKSTRPTLNKSTPKLYETIVGLYPCPVFLRGADGEVVFFNEILETTFLSKSDVAYWFSEIDFSDTFMTSVVNMTYINSEVDYAMGTGVTIDSKLWDVVVIKFFLKDEPVFLWVFLQNKNNMRTVESCSPRVIERMNALYKVVNELTYSQLITFSLFYTGASHKLISKVLNISLSTSKSRINKIQDKLHGVSRDEIFVLINASGFSVDLLNNSIKKIRERYKFLLK